ncbi:hypothetical protein ES332_A08G164200v1 [Gossypium tomentosum]|uniref:Uncharacterized protein n=1 Tax=Gossypium tomentosum TaxID=34277 RepID=A0A5D2PIU3_GOSTO|nr:hypothetical protein ES332_A08G164200v1 [Gossypium tomentosum]TYI15105.1 hypothetical protein ES332_A08G164200v1 [Gossypium tomentosum]TYI15107.1 hypothetical protein ES332_A08G164200v1 [Gossypium tomentosum]
MQENATTCLVEEIFKDFYSLPSSPFTYSSLVKPYFTLIKISPQKHSIGSHFLLPSTPTFFPFIQGQISSKFDSSKETMVEP